MYIAETERLCFFFPLIARLESPVFFASRKRSLQKKASLLFARCQVDCVHLRNLVYLHPLEAAVLQNAGKSSGVTLKS